ncbi:MAG: 4-hydroxy-tetrahydrodipicolinate synthase [Spartobacteria bacterium]|nr:4-hydroxy-tetrahydrodipicolinate synthase [Spartobacteria bacterium]
MFSGAYTAIITPFNKDGSIDFNTYRGLLDFQIENGIDGIVPMGTTGESPTLSIKEHEEVIAFTAEHCRGRVKVIAGTGGNSTSEAMELTMHAKNAGCDGTLQVTPYYNKPSQEGLYRHFSTVADVGLPVVLYNIPGRTSREISLDTVVRLAKHENIVAIKEAAGNVDKVTQYVLNCGLAILSGDDGLTYPMMACGASGVVSVASNIIPAVIVQMVHAALEERFIEAREIHRKYYALFNDLFIDTNPVPIKAAMAMKQMIQENYRLPMCEMNESLKVQLAESLKRLNLL